MTFFNNENESELREFAALAHRHASRAETLLFTALSRNAAATCSLECNSGRCWLATLTRGTVLTIGATIEHDNENDNNDKGDGDVEGDENLKELVRLLKDQAGIFYFILCFFNSCYTLVLLKQVHGPTNLVEAFCKAWGVPFESNYNFFIQFF